VFFLCVRDYGDCGPVCKYVKAEKAQKHMPKVKLEALPSTESH
jgi:hypothetical protein